MKTVGGLLAAAALVAVSGCGGDPTGGHSGSYDSLAALSKAAGCPGGKVEHLPPYLTDTGVECRTSRYHVQLLWFRDNDQRDAWQEAAASAAGTKVLLGRNRWAAASLDDSTAELETLRKMVGGTVKD